MSLDADLLIDRRRLKRRLVFWRLVAVLAVLAAILAGLHARGGAFGGGPYVARLTVDGIIGSDDRLAARVRDLADDPQVKALIVAIDSPGGSVGGGEGLHDAIAAVAAKKPVVAVMGGIAASAGYMIAVPATRIFARAGTLTGSIGVYLQSVEFSGLLARLGIDAEVVKSGPLKDEPSLTEPLSPAGKQMLQGLVMDLYDQFVAMVAQGRHMDPAIVRQLADGRPYTGAQALKLHLIDALGGEHAARRWLATARGVPASLPVRAVTLPEGLAQRALAATFGPIVQGFWKSVLSQSVGLDGAWSLWQRSIR
ncbi:MAG: signal peptide peptidase SppA [Proteobacteria bacterium]|nr:signal peptide peptidase SppA [Pseudomonadota bacterium]